MEIQIQWCLKIHGPASMGHRGAANRVLFDTQWLCSCWWQGCHFDDEYNDIVNDDDDRDDDDDDVDDVYI